MDKKIVVFSAVFVALIVAIAGVFVLLNKDGIQSPVAMDDAELKVFGNVNGDRFVDEKDLSELKKLISDGKTVDEYPLAVSYKTMSSISIH